MFLARGYICFKSLIFMQETTAIRSRIIWTKLNMQGYVGEKYTLCSVVSIIWITLIKKIVHNFKQEYIQCPCALIRSV
jgi:hypothetical protein